MKKRQTPPPRINRLAPVFAATFVLLGAGAAHAGFVTLSSSGTTVLTNCNPSNSSSTSTCKVTSLPGESGYNQTASRSAPIVINDVTVGTLYEKVWKSCTDGTLYIVATKVVLNGAIWDDSGKPFAINDLFRRALPDNSVAVAYYMDGATTALKVAGRTVKGLGEYTGSQPARQNSFADFRIATSGAGSSSGPKTSPWVLVKIKAKDGLALDAFGIRALNSSTAGGPTELFTTGYLPNGLPDDGDDD